MMVTRCSVGMCSSAAPVPDRGFTLSKSKSTGGKIDAAVALCMMHRAAAVPTPAWQPMIASV